MCKIRLFRLFLGGRGWLVSLWTKWLGQEFLLVILLFILLILLLFPFSQDPFDFRSTFELILGLNWVKNVLAITLPEIDVLIIRIDQIKFDVLKLMICSFVAERLLQQRTQPNLKNIVQHMLHQLVLLVILLIQIRIIVNLEQPYSKVLINDKIVPQKFKTVTSLFLVQLTFARKYGIYNDILHPGQKVILDGYVEVWVLLIEVILKTFKTHCITFLMQSKRAFVLALKANVRKVHHHVFFVDIILLTSGTKIAFFKEIDIKLIRNVLYMDHHPHSDVKFSAFVEQGSLYVLLNDPVAVSSLFLKVLHNVLNLREHLDTPSLIKRCRLEDPLIAQAMLLRDVLTYTQPLSNMKFTKPNFELGQFACHFLGEHKSRW